MTRTTDNTSIGTWFAEPPSRLRRFATWGAATVAGGLQRVGGNLFAEGFGILMYHRVANHVRGVEPPTVNVTPERLRRQLSGLLAQGFQCRPLSELITAHRAGECIPSHTFAVTFDDGYANNYTHALPILHELGVPATIFLATKYLDSDRPFPFDEWSARHRDRELPAVAWRPLTLRQCDALLDSGLIEFGAHTHTHQKFMGRTAEFRRDMEACLKILQDRFGVHRPVLAYPYGEFNDELVEATRKLELSCAVTALSRRVESGGDSFLWGRFHAGQSDTAAMLAARLSGWYPMLAATARSLAPGLAWRPRSESADWCRDASGNDAGLDAGVQACEARPPS
jgi:peptidoglycan/xylan/chitin deacetylase (PgdA/CDA1 family)